MELKKRLEKDLAEGKERIICCGASMFGGYFVDYAKRGNCTGIHTTGYSHVDEVDRQYIRQLGIPFFDFASLKDDPSKAWIDLMHKHEDLLKQECY